MSGSNPFLGVDHQVFVVADMGPSIEFWQGQLAIELQFRTTNEEYGVDQAFFTLPDGTFVELLAPTASSSPVAKILEKQGEGLYLLAMKVANLASAIATLQANGATVTGEGRTGCVFSQRYPVPLSFSCGPRTDRIAGGIPLQPILTSNRGRDVHDY